MLDADLLQHPVIRDRVDALVNARGGLVVYEQGLGGRETLVAAAVGIAAATGKTLTIVDAEVLREATARLVEHLGLAEHTFLSPAQATDWPTGFAPDTVLAVHGDVLRNQDLVEPLRAAARNASVNGHLVVARHPYGSSSLDTYTALLLENRGTDFMPTTAGVEPNSPDLPGPIARRARSADFQEQNTHEPPWIPRERDHQAQAADRAAEGQHTLRTTKPKDQVEPSSSADEKPTISYQEFRALVEDPDAPQAVQQRIAPVQADTSRRLRQAAAALDTPLPDHPASSQAIWPSGNDAAHRTTREAHTPAAPRSPGFRS